MKPVHEGTRYKKSGKFNSGDLVFTLTSVNNGWIMRWTQSPNHEAQVHSFSSHFHAISCRPRNSLDSSLRVLQVHFLFDSHVLSSRKVVATESEEQAQSFQSCLQVMYPKGEMLLQSVILQTEESYCLNLFVWGQRVWKTFYGLLFHLFLICEESRYSPLLPHLNTASSKPRILMGLQTKGDFMHAAMSRRVLVHRAAKSKQMGLE